MSDVLKYCVFEINRQSKHVLHHTKIKTDHVYPAKVFEKPEI